MKKFTLTLAIALTSFGFVANAQNHTSLSSDKNESITEQTRAMAQKIGLNEREYITLRNLNKERLAQSSEVENMYSNDPEMREMKLREINEHYEARLLAVMNPKQQEAYAAYKHTSETPATLAGAEEDERSATERATNVK